MIAKLQQNNLLSKYTSKIRKIYYLYPIFSTNSRIIFCKNKTYQNE
jgi:hypothetical protein